MRREEPINKKLLAIIIAIVITILLIIISIKKIMDSGKILTSIKFTPDNATILIDDNKVSNNSEILLTKGNHKIKVSLEGYKTISDDFSVSEYKNSIYGYLVPTNITDDDELEKYMETQERMFAEEDYKTEQKIIEHFPIYNYLPYNKVGDNFSIYATLSDDYSNLTVYIEPHTKEYSLVEKGCSALKNLYSKYNISNSYSEENIVVVNLNNKLSVFNNNENSDPYQFISEGYKDVENIAISDGNNDNNYYYTNIKLTESDSSYITYRIIIRKKDNSWELTGTPYPILTTFNTNNVPVRILDAANTYIPARE